MRTADRAVAPAPPKGTSRLRREQFLPRPRADVFPFFADAGNLAAITPAFLHFEVLDDLPLRMREGATIRYRLKLWGVPVRWRTRITEWEPDVRFVDVQERGPFRLWHHRHEFLEHEGGTLVRDTVDYRMPFGVLGALAHALLIRRTLDGIFDHRRDVLARRLG